MNSNSDLAFSIFKFKWVQVLLRRKEVLGKRIFSTARHAEVISAKNGLFLSHETLAISYEIGRIERVIELIALALYYRESGYQEKWVKSCTIKSPNFLRRDLGKSQDFYFLEQITQAFVNGKKHQELGRVKKGSHLDVFYYQLFKSDNDDFIIRMVFYSDFTFLAFLHEEIPTLNRIIVTAT